jgi:type II secretory pathway pseudopilin PulG
MKNKGFTLVETLVYAALFVILLGAIINSTFLLSTSYRHVKDVKNAQMSALVAMDRISREIRQASTINGAGTSYNIPSGSLLLDTGAEFFLTDGKIMMEQNNVSQGALTTNNVQVGTLMFRRIDTGNSQGVKIEMTIENKNFYNTVMLRGSY